MAELEGFEIGDPVAELKLPGAVVAHSIILDDCLNTLLVADRENGRIRVVDAYDGTEQVRGRAIGFALNAE